MPAARGTSRIGGDPDLPAGARWPTCHGRPQSFLAQVRVRKLPRELRRAGGLLLFFIAIEPDESWAGDCSAVVHARAGTRLVRRSARGPRLRAAPLRFTVHQDAERASRPWRHLFTLNADEDLGFEIADAGRIQLLIAPDDLRAGRFDRGCGVFDSG
jgi:uncharacterized protein YwqG